MDRSRLAEAPGGDWPSARGRGPFPARHSGHRPQPGSQRSPRAPGAGGGYAEMAVAAAASLHEIPDHLSAEAAVAMIGTGRTAVGILDLAALTAEDVVLVMAAADGLGSLFVQAARNVGAVVVGVAGGPEKVQRVRWLGATAAVDYLLPDWPEQVREALGGKSVSVVLDGVGGAAGRAALELLGVGGRLVMFGWSAGEPTQVTTRELVSRGLMAMWAMPRLPRRPGGLRELETLSLAEAAAGRLVPLVGPPFPLAEAAAAHRALEGRGTVGKVVLVAGSRRVAGSG
ncbi:MAG: zinc-binding dehydrogenase [Chloroflexi bacterium]|nr:zinc-binding dehydrogenase [Chloroflexota bacterium]